jgi:hypothetical protein
MKLYKYTAFTILSLCATVISTAQETIVTDRPDQTESSVTVPHKAFQLESGGVYLFDEPGDAAWGGVLLRYGLFDGFELRLGTAYGSYKDSAGTVNGLNPVEIGFKSYITKENGCLPEVAFIGSILVPGLASSNLDIKHAAPVMKFAFSHTLSPVFSIGYNLGAIWNGESPVPVWFYTLAFGGSITEKLGFYVEPYAYFQDGELPLHLINGGFTYKIAPLIQFDISGGAGLNAPAPDGFVSIGFSFRTK